MSHIMGRHGIIGHYLHYSYSHTIQFQVFLLLILPKQVLHSLDFIAKGLLLIRPGGIDGISALHGGHWRG